MTDNHHQQHDDLRPEGSSGKTTRRVSGAQLQGQLRRWLVAEDVDDSPEAERALALLFTALPAPSPGADFADRVISSVGLRPMPAVYPWWSRATIAASLFLVGLATAYALPLVFSLAQLVAPNELAGVVVQSFVGLVGRLDELLALWRIGARVVATSVLVATAPQVVLTLLALTAFSAFTFRGLNQLLSPPRSSGYVRAY